MKHSVVLLALLSLAQAPGPTLVIVNARVFTGVEAQPWAEAIAIAGDKISAVGTSLEIKPLAGASARVIDAGGRVVIPGINDAHVHIGAMPAATRLEGPPVVVQEPSFAQVVERLRAAVAKAPADSWIFGEIGGAVLDDAKATRYALDEVAPTHRVVLEAWTGHGTLMNSAALAAFGIQDNTPDPPGGFYGRMPGTKTVSGWAHEYADTMLHRRLASRASSQEWTAEIRRFAREAAAHGITTVQWMTNDLPAADAARLAAAEELPVRVRVIDFPMMPMSSWRDPASRRATGSGLVTVSGTKWIIDGTPLERLMFLREPYSDRPDTRGRLNFTPFELMTFLRAALAAQEQPMLHAVGDAAVDALLDALEKTGGEKWRPLRPRIEHGDMLEPPHFERARRFGIVLVQNPSHLMLPELMRPRLGQRASRTALLKSTVAAGIPLALGSDGPLNPYLNLMFATVAAGNPAEAISREQAIAAYTRGSAMAEFAEDRKGTLTAGAMADLAVLSQDVFKVPTDVLPQTTSVLTIVGGRVVYER
jgi:predicted amidohydrolase YtcJ